MQPKDLQIARRVLAKFKAKKQVKTEAGKEITVYEYSDRQIALRNSKKAERLEQLKKNIGRLEAKVKQDLKSSDTEKRMTALCVALINATFERVGNETSADENEHFGVTGWQRKHVTFGKGKATIKYVGKSGVSQIKEVTDVAILKALRDAYDANEKPDIFEHDDEKVDAAKVNAYLKPFNVTAKDLRGFHANSTMQGNLKAARAKGPELPTDRKDKDKILKKEFLKALAQTAETVGHEPSTLRSQYLCDTIEESYLKDGTVTSSFVKTAERTMGHSEVT